MKKSLAGAVRYISNQQAASDSRLSNQVERMKKNPRVKNNMEQLAKDSRGFVTTETENGETVTNVKVEDYKDENVSHKFDEELKTVHVYAFERRAPRDYRKLYAPVPVPDGIGPEDIRIKKEAGNVTVTVPESPEKKKKKEEAGNVTVTVPESPEKKKKKSPEKKKKKSPEKKKKK